MHLVWTRRSSHHAADVIVFWVAYSVNIDRQAGRCVQRHCWHCVLIRCFGGCSPYLTQQLLEYLLLHQDWGECSEGWAGEWGWGRGCGWGGGGVEVFSKWHIFSPQKHLPGVLKRNKWKLFVGAGGGGLKCFPYWIILFKNVPGVLKRMPIFFLGGGADFGGVWGAPRPHPGVARGRKTIHFFLWPWHVTGLNSGVVRPAWRWKVKIKNTRFKFIWLYNLCEMSAIWQYQLRNQILKHFLNKFFYEIE